MMSEQGLCVHNLIAVEAPSPNRVLFGEATIRKSVFDNRWYPYYVPTVCAAGAPNSQRGQGHNQPQTESELLQDVRQIACLEFVDETRLVEIEAVERGGKGVGPAELGRPVLL